MLSLRRRGLALVTGFSLATGFGAVAGLPLVLTAATGCNAILDNKLYDLAGSDGSTSDARADSTRPWGPDGAASEEARTVEDSAADAVRHEGGDAKQCTSGACQCPTSASPDLCGTACTNTQTDSNNCGACGRACSVAGQQCASGNCQCPSGTLSCSGSCQTPNKCGGCGTLSTNPGAACGTCGTYVCSSDMTSVSCNDPGTTNSCPTWCSSHPAPSGVAASDYECVDFDNGMPPTSTWSQTISGSGTLARSTAAADSSPDSLAVNVTGGSDAATLSWMDMGSAPISAISVSFAINPTPNFNIHPSPGGNIDLACINTGSNQTCLYYTINGNDPLGNSGFTGIGGFSIYAGGEVIRGECPFSVTNFNANVWNTVEIDITTNTTGADAVQMSLNGTVVTNSTNCGGQFGSDTMATIVLGPAAVNTPFFGWQGFLDNITVAVKR
jgi:hypothetical protein